MTAVSTGVQLSCVGEHRDLLLVSGPGWHHWRCRACGDYVEANPPYGRKRMALMGLIADVLRRARERDDRRRLDAQERARALREEVRRGCDRRT